MINDALFYQPYEIIGGEKIMAPASPLDHSSFIVELATTINLYLRQKNAATFLPMMLMFICLTEMFFSRI